MLLCIRAGQTRGHEPRKHADGAIRLRSAPSVYEINTWLWLNELSRRCGRAITLHEVPAEEWDAIAARKFDAVWLMGVWERSPEGVRIAREHPGLQSEYREALPDFMPDDVVGSPYSIHRYVVDERLGGRSGLARARTELERRGLVLILDFVPNHVATDHPWTTLHPEYFIGGDDTDLARAPSEFFRAGDRLLAHGRDPYFPPWTDTAQLNIFRSDTRQALRGILRDLLAQCDGVRCDMSILLLSSIFARTWGERAGAVPATEFWTETIAEVHAIQPEFVFIAEAYWDLEFELQKQGFDYCYDKRLRDRLIYSEAADIRAHVAADVSFQRKLIRLLENHDEARAAGLLTADKLRAASVACYTLPGARLFHKGQCEGRRIKCPVQLGRAAAEAPDAGIQQFYRNLLTIIYAELFHTGNWDLCRVTGWPDNSSSDRLLTWCWRRDPERVLVIINYSDSAAQGRVHVPWTDLDGRTLRLQDRLSSDVYDRGGDELQDAGLFVDLAPWRAQVFAIELL